MRWEWKRYRKAFVHLAAEVILRSRQCWLRISPAHRFLDPLVAAQVPLQTLARATGGAPFLGLSCTPP